ncbi:MAG: ribonuclease III [Pseudomonadota bacterium]
MAGVALTAERIEQLEKRIGHRFITHERLIRALTHASAVKKPGDISHYERLEFLGDRVLGMCIAEMLFEAFPNAREGELSVRLNALVSGETCALISDQLGLHEFIHAGGDVKQITGKRMRSVRADVVESLIAAIYLDAGLAGAKAFVTRFWADRLANANGANRDSKTALQEWAHSVTGATPTYSIARRSGPDHDPTFTIEVVVNGLEPVRAKGRSKRAAEQAAALELLLREKVWVRHANGSIEENKR